MFMACGSTIEQPEIKNLTTTQKHAATMEERQIVWWQGSPDGIPGTMQKMMMRGLHAVCTADVNKSLFVL